MGRVAVRSPATLPPALAAWLRGLTAYLWHFDSLYTPCPVHTTHVVPLALCLGLGLSLQLLACHTNQLSATWRQGLLAQIDACTQFVGSLLRSAVKQRLQTVVPFHLMLTGLMPLAAGFLAVRLSEGHGGGGREGWLYCIACTLRLLYQACTPECANGCHVQQEGGSCTHRCMRLTMLGFSRGPLVTAYVTMRVHVHVCFTGTESCCVFGCIVHCLCADMLCGCSRPVTCFHARCSPAALLARCMPGWLQGTCLPLVVSHGYCWPPCSRLARTRDTSRTPPLFSFLQRYSTSSTWREFCRHWRQQSIAHPVSGATSAASTVLVVVPALHAQQWLAVPWLHTTPLSRKAAEGAAGRVEFALAPPLGAQCRGTTWASSVCLTHNG